MNLTHKKTDVWTTEDGTVFFDQRMAERYVAHHQLVATLLNRFALSDMNGPMPSMTVYATAELILSLTFDARPNVQAHTVTSA